MRDADRSEPGRARQPDQPPLAIAAVADGEAFPPPRSAWWAVTVLTLLYALSLMDRGIVTLLVDDIRADLGITDFQIGILNGFAFALFYVTFGLLFGWAADRFSRRKIIFLGIIAWSLAATSCGAARSFAAFMGGRFCLGAGEAALNPAAYSIMADSFPRRKLATAMSVFGTGSFIGGVLATLGGAALLAALPPHVALPWLGDVNRWRLALMLTGLPGLPIAFLVWTFREPARRERSRPTLSADSGSVVAFVKRRRRFLFGHFVGHGLLGGSAYGFSLWLPTYMARRFALPISAIGVIFGVLSAIGIATTLLSGAAADRLFAKGRKDAHLLLFVVIAFVQLATIILAMIATSLWGFLFFAALAIGLASYTGTAAAALQIVTPSEIRGKISALYLGVFTLLGIGLGPASVGAFATYVFDGDSMIGWAMAANSALLLPLAALSLYSAMRPMREAVVEFRPSP